MHQCVRCNTMFEDTSINLLKGCPTCGGKFFFFIRKESLEQVKEVTERLTILDKKEIEKDARDIIGEYLEEDVPIVLDLASINIPKPGKFELDIVKIFKGEPLVYKLEEGRYIIDVAETFKVLGKKKN